MAIPGLAAAAGSDKGRRFLAGFTDFMTGGMTDLDQKGDNRMQEFQKNQAKRNFEFGKDLVGTGGLGAAGKLGSFAANAIGLNKMNGTQRMDTGETSQGAQELAQKVNENEKTGLMQKVAGFLQNQNPYNNLYPGSPENPMDPMGVPLVPGPDGNLINENLMRMTGGDRDELERRRRILVEGMDRDVAR